MADGLYQKHRPTSLKKVVGQQEAVATLRGLVDRDGVPHAVLFHGPSGCGKTTIARILKNRLGCGDRDFYEVNAANFNGVENVRQIEREMWLAPTSGKARIYLIDECHQMSKQAQDCFLKPLEDTPKHVYFFLCTTDPGKMLKTIRTRCTEIGLKPVSEQDLLALVAEVAGKEQPDVEKRPTVDVLEKIAKQAEGSARKALVLLEQVMGVSGEDEQLACLSRYDEAAPAFALVKELMPFKGLPTWAGVKGVLAKLADEDAEGLRMMVLHSAKSCFLRHNAPNQQTELAYVVCKAFKDPFFYTKHAGLAAACYEVVTTYQTPPGAKGK